MHILPTLARPAHNGNLQKDIAAGKYRVIVVGPEILMQTDGGFSKLWKKPSFTSKILHFVFDEGHCISQWGSFRLEYLHIGMLRLLIPDTIPFYVASATLPAPVLLDITEILRLRLDQTEYITQSNDRPDIHLVVRGIKFALHTFQDLAFLLPENYIEGLTPPPPKFLVFFDNTKVAEAAVRVLRMRLPPALRDKIKYFHAGMTQTYREEEYESLKGGVTWGLFVTAAFGMVSNIRAIFYHALTLYRTGYGSSRCRYCCPMEGDMQYV